MSKRCPVLHGRERMRFLRCCPTLPLRAKEDTTHCVFWHGTYLRRRNHPRGDPGVPVFFVKGHRYTARAVARALCADSPLATRGTAQTRICHCTLCINPYHVAPKRRAVAAND